MTRLAQALLLVLVAGWMTDARALVAGGRKARADCYAEWRVTTAELTGKRRVLVVCEDGDPTCDADAATDGQCTFEVSVCILQTDSALPRCAPPPEVSFAEIAEGLEPPPALTAPGCGPSSIYQVPAGRRGKQSRRILKMTAVAPTKPAKDADKLVLRCVPPSSPTVGCVRAAVPCPPNPSGPDAPNELLATIRSTGADLDNGWQGPAFNFPYAGGTKVQMCLAACDATTDPMCETYVPFGPGTGNKDSLGPPLPLFTAGLPVCVAVRFNPDLQGASRGTIDLRTGEFSGTFNLLAAIFLTDEEQVCPRCNNDRCVGGPRDGASCTVDGVMYVAESSAQDKNFKLSKDCPPPTDLPVGVLTLNMTVTTGTSTLEPLPGGSPETPCVKQPGEPAGFTPAPDSCGAGGQCVPTCGGSACATMGTDPTTGLPVCVDTKGGLSQYCCSNKPATPCHPTRAGNPVGVVSRTGKAVIDGPPWPDPTYPKAAHVVTVATFCEPASGTNAVDGLSGLPGPGALVLPSDACVFTPP